MSKRKPKRQRRAHQIKPGGDESRAKIARGHVRNSGAGSHGGTRRQQARRARQDARQSIRRGV